MNKLPSELLTFIVAFACEDDSAPARSLTQVSRHWSAIARPYRFSAITITDHSSIRPLRKLLEGTHPSERRVRKLSISNTPDSDNRESTPLLREIVALASAAGTLDTLALDPYAISGDSKWLLRTFTVFPVLRRLTLYMSRGSRAAGLLSCVKIRLFAEVFPQLEELEISLSRISAAFAFANEIEAALHAFDPSIKFMQIDDSSIQDDEDFERVRVVSRQIFSCARFPPTLKRLMIEIGACQQHETHSARSTYSESYAHMHRYMVAVLRAACKSWEASKSNLKFTLIYKQQ